MADISITNPHLFVVILLVVMSASVILGYKAGVYFRCRKILKKWERERKDFWEKQKEGGPGV